MRRLAVLALLVLVAGAPAAAAADFDGDGLDDLVVSAPFEDTGGAVDAGNLTVLPGRALSQSAFRDPPEDFDAFGTRLATGDIDGDSFDDLVVGVPDEDQPGLSSTGAVSVLFGTASGLAHRGVTFDESDVGGTLAEAETFGGAVAVGDFDGDGFGDLAVGAPGERVGQKDFAGIVTVIPGSAAGLDLASPTTFAQRFLGAQSERLDEFGASLAAGDFDGDGRDDLAVGVGGENVGDIRDAGEVDLLYGSPDGLSGERYTAFDQSDAGGTVEDMDAFGATLVAGDFDGDGRDDLIAGAPLEDVGTAFDAGNVSVLYGSPAGITTDRARPFNQSHGGGSPEADDTMGDDLAAGDIDGDGRDDLIAAASGESVGTVLQAGNVTVFPGSPTGLTSTGAGPANEGTWGGVVESADFFGDSVVLADVNGDGFADASVGAGGEDIGDDQAAGQITVVLGGPDGLDPTTAVDIQQALVEEGDVFGAEAA